MAKRILRAVAGITLVAGAVAAPVAAQSGQSGQVATGTGVVVRAMPRQVAPDAAREQALEKLTVMLRDEAGQKATWSGTLDSIVAGAPYSATTTNESVQTLADGNRIVHRNVSNVTRDSQGRVRREELDENGMVKSIIILDPVAHATFILDPANRTARKVALLLPKMVSPAGRQGVATETIRMRTQVPAGRGAVTVQPTPPEAGNVFVFSRVSPADEGQIRKEQLGTQSIEGVAAEGTRTIRTIAAGEIGNERPIEIQDEQWYSRDLQITVSSRHADPRSGETTYRVSGIRRGEPDASLFQVPSDYTMSADQMKWTAAPVKK